MVRKKLFLALMLQNMKPITLLAIRYGLKLLVLIIVLVLILAVKELIGCKLARLLMSRLSIPIPIFPPGLELVRGCTWQERQMHILIFISTAMLLPQFWPNAPLISLELPEVQ